jgi:hypothetical protein
MFVTAASSNHFKSAKQFIRSLQNAPVIFYDIGLTQAEVEEIKQMPVEYRLFDWSAVPDWGFITAPNAGSYVWKSLIVHTVMQEHHDLLIWCDAGNVVTNPSALEAYVRSVHLYTPIASSTIERWTHNTCLQEMNVPKEHYQLRIRNAAIIGFVANDPIVHQFVNEWKENCLQHKLIAGSRENHRHDQSILSCLFYKYNRACESDLVHLKIHQDCD